MVMTDREGLKKQIMESAGRVIYTYTAHWKMVDRLKKRFMCIKIIQIILTAVSTVGFLSAIITNLVALSWVSSFTAAISLGLNLYMLNFNLNEEIRQHTDAANELWDIREAYQSLIVDFDTLPEEEIRKKRDKLSAMVSRVNRLNHGTDKKSYCEAKKALKNEAEQSFDEGEVERLMVSCTQKK